MNKKGKPPYEAAKLYCICQKTAWLKNYLRNSCLDVLFLQHSTNKQAGIGHKNLHSLLLVFRDKKYFLGSHSSFILSFLQ